MEIRIIEPGGRNRWVTNCDAELGAAWLQRQLPRIMNVPYADSATLIIRPETPEEGDTLGGEQCGHLTRHGLTFLAEQLTQAAERAPRVTGEG